MTRPSSPAENREPCGWCLGSGWRGTERDPHAAPCGFCHTLGHVSPWDNERLRQWMQQNRENAAAREREGK